MESRTQSEEMYALIEGWQRSGESQRAWCAGHGISRSAFKYWLGKYRRSHRVPSCAASDFIPLEPSGQAGGSGVLTIHYPNGMVVECSSSLPPDQLRRLLTIVS